MTVSRIANISAWDNGGGLSHDMDILAEGLAGAGWEARFNGRVGREPPEGIFARVRHRVAREMGRVAVRAGLLQKPFDLNIFLEDIDPDVLNLARVNALVPNAEFFRDNTASWLDQIDVILCKTNDAFEHFAEMGCRTSLIGFTSRDQALDPPPGKVFEALHLAGSSILKGTEMLLDLWGQHPEWPLLTVVRSPVAYAGEAIPWKERVARANLSIVEGRLSNSEVQELQNSRLVYVAPSEAEGFGHSIVEALSAGAVVVTTDAPPMNEIVDSSSGIRVATKGREQMGEGWRYVIDRGDLEHQLSSLFEETTERLDALGQAARTRYERMTQAFYSNLASALEEIEASF